jgi:hypothetical protein
MVTQRLRISVGKLIDNDFPQKARIALSYLIEDLKERYYISSDERFIIRELNLIGCFVSKDFNKIIDKTFINQVFTRLQLLKWFDVLTFCERVYDKFLVEVEDQYNNIFLSLDDVREFYSKEINNILVEHNLAFVFQNGIFERIGKPQTQKNISKVGLVLLNPKLNRVKYHFNKSLAFFNQRPNSDAENCVKEALCSLEVCVEIFAEQKVSQNFDRVINQLKGNQLGKIPSPIAEAIKKIYAYRGSGQGVAHGAIGGSRVLPVDAEVVLSVVAAFITYLSDLFSMSDEIPF